MAPILSNPYSYEHEVQSLELVTFKCSADQAANPWLALPTHHPVVVQTQAFWTAIGSMTALEGAESTKWTALTWANWELGESVGGHAAYGNYRRIELDGHAAYEIVLSNDAGEPVVMFQGRGVVFRNRNFEKWREGSKEAARKAAPLEDFIYADKAALGLTQNERVLVAPLDPGIGYVESLVTDKNGFPPGNPMIGGSGDHVNSTHFHEIARQALFLIKDRTDIDTSGEMSLNRYIELGTPLRLNIHEQAERGITFELEQLGKACAKVILRW